eukprot:TRINITY_DN6365_c0_g1_i1.p1 TRINITY_DN6365_c0_g1~~TRINITY_DN6365_c0_g1_i1.p1  ORF type:complete len:145 (+),score=27.86 TRINITY_DN6365_c0_g1_i1:3-437(+)
MASGKPKHGSQRIKFEPENERLLETHQQEQATIMAQQDADLEMLESSVHRLGALGRTIHDELTEQMTFLLLCCVMFWMLCLCNPPFARMLEALDRDVSHTQSRLEQAQTKIKQVIKQANEQHSLVLICFLTAVLLILIYLVLRT